MLHYIQTIFGPDQRQLDRNLRSLKSLDDYLKVYPYDVILYAGGWCASDELWQQIVDVLHTVSFKYTLTRFPNNAGKSYVVNTLFDGNLRNTDVEYFLTADSDICFDAELCPHLFERLMEAPSHINPAMGKDFGLIALNQAGSNCHIHNALNLQMSYTNSYGNVEIMKYPSQIGGIAGGCLFTSTHNWKQVGGYRLINVYGGDDGFYLLDTHNSRHSCVMSQTISIIHPGDTDQEYAQWKHDQIGFIHRNGGHSRPLDQYLNSETKATEFWKKRS